MSRARFGPHVWSSGVAGVVACWLSVMGVGMASAQSLQSGGNPPDPTADAAYRYGLALEELRQGRHAAAQRRLEALIAEHPGSALAGEARNRVAEVRQRGSEGDGPVQRSGLGAPMPPPGASWQAEVRRTTHLADAFRTSAGDRVFFAAGSAEFGGRAREALSAQARWLAQHPEVTVTIEGHADDPGTAAENGALALRRAEAVRLRLMQEGIAPGRIRLVAHGAGRRVALCAEAVCSAQNRRAITVIGEAGGVAVVPAAMTGKAAGGGLPR